MHFTEKCKPSSLGFTITGFGVVVVERFIVVNRHSFEDDPLGTEENGSFLSRGGVVRTRPPRIVPISYVWSHTPNHAEKFGIKTAGSGLAVFENIRVWSGVRRQA